MWYIYQQNDQWLNSQTEPDSKYLTIKRMPPMPIKAGYITNLMADFDTEKVWYELTITFATVLTNKKSEISTSCNTAIKNGFDCTLSDDKTGHFSLEETDQINLTNAMLSIASGKTQYPYHADGEICKNYSAEDITAISTKATSHKLYHTTYCNHVYKWIERCETTDELDAIHYGADLPDDLQESMNEILGVTTDE